MKKGSVIAFTALILVGIIGANFLKKKVKKDVEEPILVEEKPILVEENPIKNNLFLKRKKRKTHVREKIKQKNINGRPRLSVFRSNKNIYAQIIDDKTGTTIVSASSLQMSIKGSNQVGANIIGKLIGELALKKGITEVVFDRGRYLYHGRVQAVADGAREAGLKF
uniref:50S ribosomal protein L18 n=1 Tax=viral metagenome TaxID=1070528 RepID=A0A6C0JY00_9ZZZZ